MRGDLYKGEFADNCKNGEGEFLKYNGDKIKGSFKNDKIYG